MTTTDEATSRPIRWGVIGTGSIAHTVTEDLLLLPDECTVTGVASRTRERAQEFAERVRGRIAALSFRDADDPGAPEFSVTASLGIAARVGTDADAQALIADADEALYDAKRSGKNRAVTASR